MSEQQTGRHDTYGPEGGPGPDARRHARHVHRDDQGDTDHLASIYESRDDQFAAVVPFVRDGLERGERCLYVATDNAEAEILAALREGGVDVDEALASGALSIHTKEDTYRRTGTFDREAMLEFWQETLAEARDEAGYAGVRAAAEMSWALGEEGADLDLLVEYEAALNALYEDDDYVVLCQYDRERFPAEVISDVIRSHPLVVYDGTVCQNFYYQPPEEFFGTDHASLDVDRTVEGLVSRARTRRALAEREGELRERVRQQNVVAELGQRALAERDLDGLFADVTERVAATLEADYCKVLELGADGDELCLREGVGWREGIVGEATVPADRDSLAGYTLLSEAPVIVDDLATEERFTAPDFLVDHEVTSGISVVVGSVAAPWGVLGVHTREQREFSEHDAAFVQSVANTLATAIDRVERERYQRELYEITSCADSSFDETLEALFELGCERFDLEFGGLARIDPGSDLFEVEAVGGEHDHLEPGTRVELSETYCRVHADGGTTAGVTDPEAAGFGDATAREEFGVEAYLGTLISLEDGPDRTFFFVSSEPGGRAFSETERTFLRTMAEWVQRELERREYQRKLEESNERLEQFAYAASHDLQEPLRMVSSYLQLIEQRYADELDEDGREFIEYASDGADRMREMIDGLLEYSRIETRGEPFAPVDLEAVLDDVLADLQLQVEETDAEVTVASLPTVEGDAGQLRQVVQNLLDNAIEYSGDEPPVVHVDAERRDDGWVVVSVADEGVGVDPDDQERIFRVFQRLHTRDEHEGTGIGLALCERIVDRHGGEIRVESDPGEGATFRFTLPTPEGDR